MTHERPHIHPPESPGAEPDAEALLPAWVSANLRYPLRPCQEEAVRRFVRFWQAEGPSGPVSPHVLFHMATGSGKTLVMAALVLWLYRQGYRRFLFFVHSTQIIRKTEANFLDPAAAKFLFRAPVRIDGREVRLLHVRTFDEADPDHINLHFTTIQQLHLDLAEAREHALTMETLQQEPLVLLADEAHHLSSGTRRADLSRSWEETVVRLHRARPANVLLEFTATLDLDRPDIRDKYAGRILFRYDLRRFRHDGYSKEIRLVRSHYDERDRILQALVLHLYRQELAARHGLSLKPVILFKARRTIKESEANKARFHALIDALDAAHIQHIRHTAQVPLVQQAFAFFDRVGLDAAAIARRLRFCFKPENCLSANNEAEAERNQMLLNTLEDDDNPIRAVFAVQKLNEGWDVLNLFDIVRLYDGTDGTARRPGKTTLSEAQLIGRGARYWPFRLRPDDDPWRRKFDDQPEHELRILETLCYHTREDNRYIAELHQALTDTGLREENPSRLRAAHARRQPRSAASARPVFPLPQKIEYMLPSGAGSATLALETEKGGAALPSVEKREIKIGEMPLHVVRYALATSPAFRFDRLKQCFPELRATSEFIRSERYLGAQPIVFVGPPDRLARLTAADYLAALRHWLPQAEAALGTAMPL